MFVYLGKITAPEQGERYIKIILDLDATPEGCTIESPGQDGRIKPYILIWQLWENTKCMGNNVMTMDAINPGLI